MNLHITVTFTTEFSFDFKVKLETRLYASI